MTPKPATDASVVNGVPFLDESEDAMTTLQSRELVQAYGTLKQHFAGQTVFVTCEMPVPYDRTDLRKTVKADVMVVRGVPPGIRPMYVPWREGQPPHWVLEVASATTAERDREEKLPLYQLLQTSEVVLFDAEWMYHPKVLTVYRLGTEGYREVEEDKRGRVRSEVLGLELAAVDYREDNARYWTLRFYRPGESHPLPTWEELAAGKEEVLDRGREQGREQGERVAKRDTLLRQLRRKFGAVPEETEGRMMAIVDIARLDELLDRILTATRIEEMEP